MDYKFRCENEEGRSWEIWVKANCIADAEDKVLDDPNVSGCELLQIGKVGG